MKISGKFIVKVAGTLTAIALVVAALLGVVNMVTAEKIAALNAKATAEALAKVIPEGAETGDALTVEAAAMDAASAQGGTVKGLYPVSVNGEAAGYALTVVASGSQGKIEMAVGVDAAGAVTGVSIISNAETSGIGSKVMGNEPNDAGVPVLDQFIGLSGAGSLTVGSNVTAISGATVSTKGVTKGVNAALAAVEALG